MCASNLLPYAQWALAIGYRMCSLRYQFATVYAVYTNKADHMLILPIYLNQVLTNEKSENQKKLFWHLQVDLKEIWKNFFFG